MNLLLLALIVLLILTFGGWGYGSYRGGAYASPMGILGLLLIIALLLVLFSGWGFYYPPRAL